MRRALIRSICLLLSLFLFVYPAVSEEFFLVRVERDRKGGETEIQYLERLGFTYLRVVDSGKHEEHLVSVSYELPASFIKNLKKSERRLRDIKPFEDLTHDQKRNDGREAPVQYLVRVENDHRSDEVEIQLLERLGFTYLRSVDSVRREVHQISAPFALTSSFIKELKKSERRISEIELVEDLYLTDIVENEAHDSALQRALNYAQTVALQGSTREKYHGATVLKGYATQRVVDSLDFDSVHRRYGTGDSVIAIIDTGVDPYHPGLVGSLVPGYDFIFDESGYASELKELDVELTQQLIKSGSGPGSVDQSSVAILSQSSVAILDQSSVAILSQSSVAILSQPEYQSFGHGTMVAGMIRLVAPGAKIMPLKAFGPDGSASTANIVAAIYFAVENGADVINMSFSFEAFSEETMRAINHATRQGVICISAAGNLGTEMLVYPASLANVTGVAAITEDQELSSTSSYGEDLVSLATFGEALVTTYPGGLYASVFGTSFSTAIVSGAVAILRDNEEGLDQDGAEKALAMKRPRSGDLGHGVLDIEGALKMFKKKKKR